MACGRPLPTQSLNVLPHREQRSLLFARDGDFAPVSARPQAAFLTFLAAAFLLSACSREKEPTSPKTDGRVLSPAAVFRNVDSATRFVGDDACFDCHETLYTGYQEHGMARADYAPLSVRVTEQ